jgi:hypothetical protein
VTNIEWATWATAIGTVAAAVAAVGIALWSHRIEVQRDEIREFRAARDREITDLDETRRLLTVMLVRRPVLADPVLFGTIVHALVKHSGLIGEVDRAASLLQDYFSTDSNRRDFEELVAIIDKRLVELKSEDAPTAEVPRP